MKTKTAKLLCETNTKVVEAQIREAFRLSRNTHSQRLSNIQTWFEHGQWWVIDNGTGAQWSVIDANTESGFDFELVTPPRD